MPDSFYVRDGDRFISTELTRGPWDPGAQHAGPPAALLGREIERFAGGRIGGDGPEAMIGRVTFEVLRPVPIEPLRVEVEAVRPGRSVELLRGSLLGEAGELLRATAWRLRRERVELPAGLVPTDAPLGPEPGQAQDFFPTGQDVGYHTAMEYSFTAGGFLELGPATVWMRMRHPLVEDERPSPLQRVLAAADSGNGVSATLDFRRYVFINVDLSVHLHRMPEGEWVCLDSITFPEPTGVGLADTRLYDERGPLGRALQTLLVGERATGSLRTASG